MAAGTMARTKPKHAPMTAERSALKEMKARFDPAKLSPENRLSYRLFEKRAARSEAAFKYNDYGYVFDQMNGAQSQIPAFLINIHRIDTKSDARAYINRLYGIGPGDESKPSHRPRHAPPRASCRPNGFTPMSSATRATSSPARRSVKVPDAPLFADFKGKVAKLTISQVGKGPADRATPHRR